MHGKKQMCEMGCNYQDLLSFSRKLGNVFCSQLELPHCTSNVTSVGKESQKVLAKTTGVIVLGFIQVSFPLKCLQYK